MRQRKRVLMVDDDPINTELIVTRAPSQSLRRGKLAGQDFPRDAVVAHDGAMGPEFRSAPVLGRSGVENPGSSVRSHESVYLDVAAPEDGRTPPAANPAFTE